MKLALCMLALTALTEASEPPHVALKITNGYGRAVHVAIGPVDLTAEVRVTPHEPHRWLETTWDYAPPEPRIDTNDDTADPFREPDEQNGSIGSEVRSLDGERERYRHAVKLAHLEGGTYDIRATVYTDEGRKMVCGRASARVTVR